MKTNAVELLHGATHRVPGVPDHGRASELNHRSKAEAHQHGQGRHPRFAQRNAHHDAPPRVLIAWQNWIAETLRLLKRPQRTR